MSAEEQAAIEAFALAMQRCREAPSPASAAYQQAMRDYGREVKRLEAESGLDAAREMESAAHEAIRQARAGLLETPAKTLRGLIFKARYATYEDADLMAAIVDDLLATADDPAA